MQTLGFKTGPSLHPVVGLDEQSPTNWPARIAVLAVVLGWKVVMGSCHDFAAAIGAPVNSRSQRSLARLKVLIERGAVSQHQHVSVLEESHHSLPA